MIIHRIERGREILLRLVWDVQSKNPVRCIYILRSNKAGRRRRRRRRRRDACQPLAVSESTYRKYTYIYARGDSLNYCTLFDGNRKRVRRVMF